MLNLRHYRRMCSPAGARHHFGGDSSSAQTTNNTDARIVGGDDAQSASVVGNTGPVSITSTDHGAVNASIGLALKGVEQANKTTQQTVAQTGGLLEGALRNSGQQAQQFTETIKDIKTSDVRVLVIAGLAVVGLGAVMFLKKG